MTARSNRFVANHEGFAAGSSKAPHGSKPSQSSCQLRIRRLGRVASSGRACPEWTGVCVNRRQPIFLVAWIPPGAATAVRGPPLRAEPKIPDSEGGGDRGEGQGGNRIGITINGKRTAGIGTTVEPLPEPVAGV